MSSIRWGILGAGRISNTFCRDAALVETAQVTAVAARDGNSARAFAAQHQIETAHEGYQALYQDSNVDAIYIATPHNYHFEQALAALRAGKHVLCEKPFTVSAQQCATLMHEARTHQRFMMEAMWTRFLPAIITAKDWLDSGRIGKLLHVKVDFGYPIPYSPDSREYDARLNGGCLLEMGIYPLAIAQLFTDKQPDDIQLLHKHAPNGVEDDVMIQARYGDVWGQLGTSFRTRLRNSAVLVGEQGYIHIPDAFCASRCSLHAIDDQVDAFEDDRQGSGFEFEIAAACEAIKAGQLQTAEMPWSSSLALQQQMDSMLVMMKRDSQ